MSQVSKALWYIESNLFQELSLEEVSYAAHASRFHLARVFHRATGFTVMGYVRARRLSEAATLLSADPGGNILSVALEVGYSSHEAFSRAFAQFFGVYPHAYRREPDLATRPPVAPLTLNDESRPALEPTRFEESGPLTIMGIREQYYRDANGGIPAQWARFVPLIPEIRNRLDDCSYGVCSHSYPEEAFVYLAGVRTADGTAGSEGFSVARLPAVRYAVFLHDDHISTIRETAIAVWSLWLPASGLRLAASPDFERYLSSFDGRTGIGGVELWVPVEW